MQRKGIANLPMHTGHTPRWLWERMVKLSKAISEVIIDEYGQVELLERDCEYLCINPPVGFRVFHV